MDREKVGGKGGEDRRKVGGKGGGIERRLEGRRLVGIDERFEG